MGAYNKEPIKTVSVFIDEVIKIKIKAESISTLYFRGQPKSYDALCPNDSDSECKVKLIRQLRPSIFRNVKLIENEDSIYREAILANPDDFKDDKTTLEKLVRMQHYGVPTRLLDITTNALMGLYFACEYDEEQKFKKKCFLFKNIQMNEDGFVFILDIPDDKIKYYDSDTVSVLSNIAKRPIQKHGTVDPLDFTDSKYSQYWQKTENNIAGFNEKIIIQKLLHEIREEKPYFKSIINPNHLEEILCVKPLMKNRRIIRQDGAFLLFGMRKNKMDYPEVPEKWVNIIKIDGNSKRNILKELKMLGVSKDKVYPELEKVGGYLKEKYN